VQVPSTTEAATTTTTNTTNTNTTNTAAASRTTGDSFQEALDTVAGKTAVVRDPAASAAVVGSERGATAFEEAEERAGQAWEKVSRGAVMMLILKPRSSVNRPAECKSLALVLRAVARAVWHSQT
jgi:hypothetical protein